MAQLSPSLLDTFFLRLGYSSNSSKLYLTSSQSQVNITVTSEPEPKPQRGCDIKANKSCILRFENIYLFLVVPSHLTYPPLRKLQYTSARSNLTPASIVAHAFTCLPNVRAFCPRHLPRITMDIYKNVFLNKHAL